MPQREPDVDAEPNVAAAIAIQFGGDAALYRAYAATCAVQFGVDRAVGQVACETGELPDLRRLAHNLKSALGLLGHDRASSLAAHIEERAAAGDLNSACMSWRALDAALLRLEAP
jgi:hypothetical protein